MMGTLVSSFGVNYGQIADNLPSPADVVPLVKSIGATKVKLFDANPSILHAFANSGLEFVVCVPNELLSEISDPDNAESWVKSNVQAYLPATKITSIAVGNEILFNNIQLSSNLLPAMQSVRSALINLGLEKQVSVTTPHSFSILETSYPPSASVFRQDLEVFITPILEFLSKANSPFFINTYPYFAYKANPEKVSLDFVLFQSNAGFIDPSSNLHYDNMLFAQIDAVYSALDALGYKNLPVHISETGWPAKGDPDEAGATIENARTYNGNLIKIIAQKKGTPMRPNGNLDIYIFALFNEDMKLGPTSERNFGLFKPDGTAAYDLGIPKSKGGVGNTTSTSGGSCGNTTSTSGGCFGNTTSTSGGSFGNTTSTSGGCFGNTTSTSGGSCGNTTSSGGSGLIISGCGGDSGEDPRESPTALPCHSSSGRIGCSWCSLFTLVCGLTMMFQQH